MRRTLLILAIACALSLGSLIVDTPAYAPIIDSCTGAQIVLASWQSAFQGCLEDYGLGGCTGEWSMVLEWQNNVNQNCNLTSS
jgi:hypothetical protein